MIIGPNFVWLHFPKTAGTATERLLRHFFSARTDVKFDILGVRPVTWHQTIEQRTQIDPAFSITDRTVICGFRRLPAWLMSRTTYEASRAPYRIATRAMIESGQFFENDGTVNHADAYLRNYSRPRVDAWLRSEHLAVDIAKAFGLPESDIRTHLKVANRSEKVDDPAFWFTQQQIAALYAQNPLWAALERELYGDLVSL